MNIGFAERLSILEKDVQEWKIKSAEHEKWRKLLEEWIFVQFGYSFAQDLEKSQDSSCNSQSTTTTTGTAIPSQQQDVNQNSPAFNILEDVIIIKQEPLDPLIPSLLSTQDKINSRSTELYSPNPKLRSCTDQAVTNEQSTDVSGAKTAIFSDGIFGGVEEDQFHFNSVRVTGSTVKTMNENSASTGSSTLSATTSAASVTGNKPIKHRVMRDWEKIRTFGNAQEAEAFIEAENTWSKTGSHKTKEGLKKYYRCNKAKGNTCPAQVFLLYESDSLKVSLHRTEDEHFHPSLPNCRGIPSETKEVIKALYNEGLTKPRQIIAAFRKRNIQGVSKIQLSNYICQLRTKCEKKNQSLSVQQNVSTSSDELLPHADQFLGHLY